MTTILEIRSDHEQIVNDAYNKHYNKKTDTFEIEINDAVKMYQHVFDNYINGVLRNKQLRSPNITRFINEIIRVLDDYFLHEAPRITQEDIDNKDHVFYRGEKKLCPDGNCRSGLITSFSSLSENVDAAIGFTNGTCCLYVYKLDIGVPYLDVNKLLEEYGEDNDASDEYEFILPRGVILGPLLKKTKKKLPYTFYNVDEFILDVSYDPNYIESRMIPVYTPHPQNPDEYTPTPEKKSKESSPVFTFYDDDDDDNVKWEEPFKISPIADNHDDDDNVKWEEYEPATIHPTPTVSRETTKKRKKVVVKSKRNNKYRKNKC